MDEKHISNPDSEVKGIPIEHGSTKYVKQKGYICGIVVINYSCAWVIQSHYLIS